MSVKMDSGSLYPNKSVLDHQLQPKIREMKSIQTNRVRGNEAHLWKGAYVDLIRLGTLEINHNRIYTNSRVPLPEGELDLDGVKKTRYIFEQIADKLDSSSLAIRAAHLFQQDFGGGILEAVARKKGLVQGNEGDYVMHSTHAVTAKEKFNSLTTYQGKNRFKLIHEELIEARPMEDIEKVSYFKIKTIVTGKITALETKQSADMRIKTAYTKEYSRKLDTYNANYFGTRAAGINDTKSYITRKED